MCSGGATQEETQDWGSLLCAKCSPRLPGKTRLQCCKCISQPYIVWLFSSANTPDPTVQLIIQHFMSRLRKTSVRFRLENPIHVCSWTASLFFFISHTCTQEMELMVKEKEREVERVEEQACALVQNKTDEACAVVMETLQALNHTWANLDHLVC